MAWKELEARLAFVARRPAGHWRLHNWRVVGVECPNSVVPRWWARGVLRLQYPAYELHRRGCGLRSTDVENATPAQPGVISAPVEELVHAIHVEAVQVAA